MVRTFSGIIMLSSLVHDSNALSAIVARLLPSANVTFCKLEHPTNAHGPTKVRDFGNVIDVMEVQP